MLPPNVNTRELAPLPKTAVALFVQPAQQQQRHGRDDAAAASRDAAYRRGRAVQDVPRTAQARSQGTPSCSQNAHQSHTALTCFHVLLLACTRRSVCTHLLSLQCMSHDHRTFHRPVKTSPRKPARRPKRLALQSLQRKRPKPNNSSWYGTRLPFNVSSRQGCIHTNHTGQGEEGGPRCAAQV